MKKTFDEVVKDIDESEKNVDKVLKAGRLERHEKSPMSDTMILHLLNYAVGTIAMIMGFAALYMIIYFMGT